MSLTDDESLVMVVYGYQRLIDEDDGSEGIYCTVFHPEVTDSHAHHELMNGYDDYPFVFTRISRDQKRVYEAQPMSKALRGPQMQIKTERDSRVDRASLATMPPLMHPAGRPPSDWGPGRRVPYRRLGEIQFGPTPPNDPGSMEVEISMRMQADRAVGLDMENPLFEADNISKKSNDHVYRTYRLDRISQATRMTGSTHIPMPFVYDSVKMNLMPNGLPTLDAQGIPLAR